MVSTALLAGTAGAQTAMRFDLASTGGRTTVASSTVTQPDREQPVDTAVPLVVTVNCAAPVDCRRVTATLVSTEKPQGEGPRGSAPTERAGRFEFTPDLLAGRTNLRLQLSDGAAEVTRIALAPAAAPAARATQQQEAARDEPSTLADLVTYDCSSELAAARESMGSVYGRRENLARFLVAPNGNLWNRPPVNVMDENDLLQVVVVAHPRLLSALRVRRTSAFRVPGVLSIVGQDVTVPDFQRKSAPAIPAARTACVAAVLPVSDFQPGRGEVSLSVTTAKGDVTTGSFEFGVNTLYSGAFALGAMRTRLRDQRYGLLATGSDSVITVTEGSTPRVLYTLTYTPFVWGRRDLEKEDAVLGWRRLNPMFGIAVNDVSNNFLGGLSYDLSSAVYLSAGVHLGRVRRLNEDAGAAVGKPFAGTSAQIPTTHDWRTETFVGVALDLRAAARFIRTATGAAAGTGGG